MHRVPRHSVLMAVAAMTALAGCAAPAPVSNLAACSEALLAAGTINPATLAGVAIQTPACQTLAAEALAALINSVAAQQKARGIRQ